METKKVSIGSIYADLNQGISAEWRFPEGFDASKKHPVIISPTPSARAKSKPQATCTPKA